MADQVRHRSTARSARVLAVTAVLALTVVAAACSGGGKQVDVAAQSAGAAADGDGTATTTVVPEATTSTAKASPATTRRAQTTKPAKPVVTTAPQPGEAATTQPTVAESVTTQPQPIAPGRQPKRIAYPSGGAKGMVYPPSHDAFAMITSPARCQELLDKSLLWEPSDILRPRRVYLYRSAANACLSHWDAAVADFDRLAPHVAEFAAAAADDPACPADANDGGECARCDQVVLAWLTDVVTTYLSDRNLPPVLVGTAAALPC